MRTEPEYEAFYSGALMVKRAKFDWNHRKSNGRLLHPPVVYVNHPTAHYGLPASYEIPWKAAEILAPSEMRELTDKITFHRDLEAKTMEANLRGEK